MADIFVSYTRADYTKVQPIVDLLKHQSWDVWWDTRISGGERWDAVLENEIRAARCVVVVWSPVSINRFWVKEEANFARGEEKLVPATVEGVTAPFGFHIIQSVNLTDWDGTIDHPAAGRLIESVSKMLAGRPPSAGASSSVDAASAPSPPSSSPYAARDWASVKETKDPRELQAYLQEHPTGLHARLAMNRLLDLADAAWSALIGTPTISDAQRFITMFPESDRIGAAGSLLAKLEGAAKAERRVREERERKTREDEDKKRAAEEERFRPLEVRVGASSSEVVKLLTPGAGKAERFKDCEQGPQMLVVPGGKHESAELLPGVLLVGPSSDSDHEDPNTFRPVKYPRTIKPFAVGRYPVTVGELKRFTARPAASCQTACSRSKMASGKSAPADHSTTLDLHRPLVIRWWGSTSKMQMTTVAGFRC